MFCELLVKRRAGVCDEDPREGLLRLPFGRTQSVFEACVSPRTAE